MRNNRPNIFDYATKELSQDAMICWLLKCYHSEDKKYKQIGLDFIKLILEDETLTFDDVELEDHSPHIQYYRMDVYANIRVNNKIIPVIFEDKTDTYLHGDQHNNYCREVSIWKNDPKWEDWKNGLFSTHNLEWERTVFVFFKTGYVFDWQKAELLEVEKSISDYDAELKTVYLDDIKSFIEKVKDSDEMLFDYYLHLQKKKENLKICTEHKCNEYYKKILGRNKRFNYNHQGWAAKDFGVIKDKNNIEDNHIWYALRTGWWKKGSNYEYAIALQQYRNEKSIKIINSEKENLQKERAEITEKTRKICEEIFEELNIKEMLNLEYNDRNRMPAQNNIFKLFINDDNEDEVCNIFKRFIEKFNKKARKEFEKFEEVN